METFGSETRTARKTHLCIYCGAHVKPGEKYHRWAWSDCGRVFSACCHAQCWMMSGAIYRYDDDEVWDWGEFRAACREELPDNRPFPWESAT